MSRFLSLGFHEPLAVPFLASEYSISLQPDEYSWDIYTSGGCESKEPEDEVFFTKHLVVWSQGGTVQRIFRFEESEDEVIRAVLTSFPVNELVERGNIRTTKVTRTANIRFPKGDGITSAPSGMTGTQDVEEKKQCLPQKALVVLMKTEVHIFMLGGNSYIIHLPFEAESVLPAPKGIILYRKLTSREDLTSSFVPPVPQNSFASFSSTANQIHFPHVSTRPGKRSRASMKSELLFGGIQPHSLGADPTTNLPRIFSLVDPFSELGVVVAATSSSEKSNVLSIEGLDRQEQLLHLCEVDIHANASPPLILGLSLNTYSGTYTLWKARYSVKANAPSVARSLAPTTPSILSQRRRSSAARGTPSGTDTPNWSRSRGFRESFGGASQYDSRKSLPGSQDAAKAEKRDFAAALDPDEDYARSSRRVSSLLARTDLSTGHEWSNFTDFGNGGSFGSATLGRTRDSFGGKIRHSLGSSFGLNIRNSFTSTQSQDTSIADTSFAGLSTDGEFLDSLSLDDSTEEHERIVFSDRMSSLHREIILSKIKSFQNPSLMNTLSSTTWDRRQLKVIIVKCPRTAASHPDNMRSMILGIMDSKNHELMVLTLRIELSPSKASIGKSEDSFQIGNIQVTEMRSGTNILDASKIVDGGISRLLVLSQIPDRGCEISLQAPWSPLWKVQMPEVIPQMTLKLPGVLKLRADSIHFDNNSAAPNSWIAIPQTSHSGLVDFLDKNGRYYRVQIQMEPRDCQVKKLLQVCRFALPGADNAGEGMVVGWWSVKTWLHTREEAMYDTEHTAFIVLLFCMAVAFIPEQHSFIPADTPSGTSQASFFQETCDTIESSGSWLNTSSWSWVKETPLFNSPPRQNIYLLKCADLAREFLKSANGQAAIGKDGYLPTSISRNPEIQKAALPKIIMALHLLREEQKLDIGTEAIDPLGNISLACVIAQIGSWIGWQSWGYGPDSYYSLENTEIDEYVFDDSRIPPSILGIPAAPFPPPAIFNFIGNSIRNTSMAPYLSLLDIAGRDRYSGTQLVKQYTPRTVELVSFFNSIRNQDFSPSAWTSAIAEAGFHLPQLEILPEGVSAPLYETLLGCRASPPTSWTGDLLDLVGRTDLRMLSRGSHEPNFSPRSSSLPINHVATRDFHSIGQSVVMALEDDKVAAWDSSIEIDHQAVTRLIFSQDRRFDEAVKLLSPLTPSVARCVPRPEWSDVELLESEKDVVETVAWRTLSISPGRGMLQFSSKIPLLTEKLPLLGFTLTCIMTPSNNTITAEKALFTEEKVSWAFFHAGVATGLSISRDAKGIDTSWILFNKPPELTNRHAGFLLALGLNGHLKNIAKWVAFKYLTPKHTMTSIGLLLGLAASYLGSMDSLITRLLSVHVTRMLPPGAAELNLSPLTQTTGIMGIGLLYCNSQHRRMSEIMLSEIENVEQEDSLTPLEMLRDESYRLAAGFSLGFINLGKGKDLQGLQDMHLVERLISLAVTSKTVSLVHLLDKATPAAIISIALIFLKTNDKSVARRIDIPDTVHQFDYVRPDTFLLRTVAKHLIMWDSIEPTFEWITRNMLPIFQSRAKLGLVRTLNSEDLPFFNTIAGLCFAIGLRFAGSGRTDARDILIHYLDQFMRLSRLPALNYDSKLTRVTVRNCQDLLALCGSTVMAGSGDLHIFRRLRSLHGRIDPGVSWGSHLAGHLAIGALFLGGGQYTFSTSNLAIASLLCAFYPLFPVSVHDNKVHLQAFRHLWVLAVEPRCIVARDIATCKPVSVPVQLKLKSGQTQTTILPCILPDLTNIACLTIDSTEYWPLTLDFVSNSDHLTRLRSNQSIYVRRRVPYDAPNSAVFQYTFAGINEAMSSTSTRNILDWFLSLPSFSSFGWFAMGKALPQGWTTASAGIEGTVIDNRLVFERSELVNGSQDALWNLRLLFEWAERCRIEGHKDLAWIGSKVVDELKARVWMASRAQSES